jgi:hypothetical protein
LLLLQPATTQNNASAGKGKGKASKAAPTDELTVLSSTNLMVLSSACHSWLQSTLFTSCFQALELLFQPQILHTNVEEMAALVGYVSEMIVHLAENMVGLSTLMKNMYRFPPNDEEIIHQLWTACLQVILHHFIRFIL